MCKGSKPMCEFNIPNMTAHCSIENVKVRHSKITLLYMNSHDDASNVHFVYFLGVLK